MLSVKELSSSLIALGLLHSGKSPTSIYAMRTEFKQSAIAATPSLPTMKTLDERCREMFTGLKNDPKVFSVALCVINRLLGSAVPKNYSMSCEAKQQGVISAGDMCR